MARIRILDLVTLVEGDSRISGGSGVAPLLTTIAASNATAVGIKAAMMGNDFDSSARSIVKDTITGGVSGGINVIEPGDIAAIIKLGTPKSP